jgi:hypothetical protein
MSPADIATDQTIVALAALLRHSSAAHCKSFALAMHESLCERGEFSHADVWLGVVRLLADTGTAVPRTGFSNMAGAGLTRCRRTALG